MSDRFSLRWERDVYRILIRFRCQVFLECRDSINIWLLTEPRRSLSESVLLSRINVEQRNDNNQHQAFHEEKEARNEDVVFVVRIRVGDKRSQRQSPRQPDELSFGVPHENYSRQNSVDRSQ